MLLIIKRDGSVVEFNRAKIENAVLAAFEEVDGEITDYAQTKANNIADFVEEKANEADHEFNVEEIQDLVERGLMACRRKDVAKAYITYRNERTRARGNTTDKVIQEIVSGTSDYWTNENSNKNAMIASTQRDYMAGSVSEDISRRKLLPDDVVALHDRGVIHFHDVDYFAQHIPNCCLVNLDDMLQNGTVINQTLIEKPHSFSTACTVATQIIAVIASGQYGGQSISLAHLAPFVDVSRKKITKEVTSELKGKVDDELIESIIEKRLKDEIKSGVQTIQYQINTLNTSNGQTPFVTIFMYLDEAKNEREKADLAMVIEEVLKQRYQGTKNEKGVWITPAFPKLIYVLDEDNIHDDSPYYYLTKLAAKCTARRMVPDYISAKIMRELKGDMYPCMGCRSFLTPDRFTDKGWGNQANALNYVKGAHKYYGRFNQGVVTINLPYVALEANKDLDKFWELLDKYIAVCHKGLQYKHNRLLGTPSDISPIHWQHGGLARLEKGEPIDKLLYDGYSTISLGYAGLWECVYALIGKKLTEPEGEALGLKIMEKLNEYCQTWKAAENIDYSLYGTPIESTTYKFAKALKRDFGEIKGVSDKDYITNSYHVHVTEPIDAFSKIALESKFQALSPGGAITYVEVPNMENNLDAVVEIMRFIYNHIIYAELNTKSDYCQVCGWTGEIEIKGEPGHLYWQCPNCGNTDQKKMNVARRTCGYIGSNFWNQGRTEEIKERVLHVD